MIGHCRKEWQVQPTRLDLLRYHAFLSMYGKNVFPLTSIDVACDELSAITGSYVTALTMAETVAGPIA